MVGVLLLLTPGQAQQTAETPRPVTDQELLEPDPADWLMWRRTLNSWGYRPLDQIDKSNVGRLQLVWTRGMGPGIQEATPLVHDGVMYLANPSDYIQAFNAATGELKWEYKRELPEDLNRFLPVPSINRNLAIYGNQIIDTSADDFVFALDSQTGELVWENRIVDYRETPAQETSGPIIANGKIYSTRGCEYKFSPDGCIITAHDAVTGKELWRRRTIPRPAELGDESWGGIPDEKRRHVGAWMVPSYDAELNLLYVGTSVTSPAPKFLLAGNDKEYLFHNSTLALDGDTGEAVACANGNGMYFDMSNRIVKNQGTKEFEYSYAPGNKRVWKGTWDTGTGSTHPPAEHWTRLPASLVLCIAGRAPKTQTE